MKAIVTAIGLEKIAKHLALLACLAVVFKANGWTDTGEPAIVALAIGACLVHRWARWLMVRTRPGPRR